MDVRRSVAGCVLTGATLAACGQATVPADTARSSPSVSMPAQDAAPPPSPSPESVTFVKPTWETIDTTFLLASPDGTRVRGQLSISPILPASDAESLRNAIAYLTDGGASDVPCLGEADKSRDGMVIGIWTFLNETPNFSVAPEINHTGVKRVGFAYSSGAECPDDFAGGFSLSPKMTDAQWGPVGVAFLIKNLYSPAHPQGDPAVAKEAAVNLSSLQEFQEVRGRRATD